MTLVLSRIQNREWSFFLSFWRISRKSEKKLIKLVTVTSCSLIFLPTDAIILPPTFASPPQECFSRHYFVPCEQDGHCLDFIFRRSMLSQESFSARCKLMERKQTNISRKMTQFSLSHPTFFSLHISTRLMILITVSHLHIYIFSVVCGVLCHVLPVFIYLSHSKVNLPLSCACRFLELPSNFQLQVTIPANTHSLANWGSEIWGGREQMRDDIMAVRRRNQIKLLHNDQVWSWFGILSLIRQAIGMKYWDCHHSLSS